MLPIRKKIVLFDIDGTLFDSRFFGERVRTQFTKTLKIDLVEVENVSSKYFENLESGTDFHPQAFIKFLAGKLAIKNAVLWKIFWENEENYKKALYPEVTKTLCQLVTNNKLGIYSQGFRKFQLHKLSQSGILDFFQKEYIFISRRKLRPSLTKSMPESSVIVDNHPGVVEKLNSTKRFNIIWLNRISNEKMASIQTIKKLDDLITP
ncbi:MAG: HAD hydrolase-like protein [Patescibacteria group bacterium]|nr:HAD hydrolase-like protein [Patescibacteria group bacterium]